MANIGRRQTLQRKYFTCITCLCCFVRVRTLVFKTYFFKSNRIFDWVESCCEVQCSWPTLLKLVHSKYENFTNLYGWNLDFSQCVADSRELQLTLRMSPYYQELYKPSFYWLALLASQLRYVTLRLLFDDDVRLNIIYRWWYGDYWPPLWSSGQGSWVQMQRFGVNSRRYQIFWEIVDLEMGSTQSRENNWGAISRK
jgi:hypothetical protein